MDFSVSTLESYLRNNAINDFDEIYDDIDDEQVTSDIKRRNRQLTVDLWAIGWGQMLRNETSNDPQG